MEKEKYVLSGGSVMKIDRLFAITNILLDKKSVTASELASKFEVSVRTIYRDLDILSANGIPIMTMQGKGGGISLMDHYAIDKNMFSKEEQEKILMALQSVQAMNQFDIDDPLSKLRGLFNRDMDSWIEIDFNGWEQSEEQSRLFSLIKHAIWNKKVLSFSYIDGKGQESERLVEPFRLIFKGFSWYLYGYCRLRKDFRFFKMIRMERVAEVNEATTMEPENHNISFAFHNNEKDKQETICLKIKGRMAYRVYDEFRMAQVTKEGDGFLVRAKMTYNPDLMDYFLGFGPSLEIIEPVWLREQFIEYIKKVLKVY